MSAVQVHVLIIVTITTEVLPAAVIPAMKKLVVHVVC